MKILTNKHHCEKNLVMNIDNCKIYIKSWSEIFTEFELNFNYLNEKLCLDYTKLVFADNLTADEIIEKLQKVPVKCE